MLYGTNKTFSLQSLYIIAFYSIHSYFGSFEHRFIRHVRQHQKSNTHKNKPKGLKHKFTYICTGSGDMQVRHDPQLSIIVANQSVSRRARVVNGCVSGCLFDRITLSARACVHHQRGRRRRRTLVQFTTVQRPIQRPVSAAATRRQ